MSYVAVSGDAPTNYHSAHTYELEDLDSGFDITGRVDVIPDGGELEVQYRRAGYSEWLDAVPVAEPRYGWEFPSENIVAFRVCGSGSYHITVYPLG